MGFSAIRLTFFTVTVRYFLRRRHFESSYSTKWTHARIGDVALLTKFDDRAYMIMTS